MSDTDLLYRRARLLAWFTVIYNIIEGAVSIGFGYAAGSIALTGFGFDSLVESFSGGIMIWRLSPRNRGSEEAESRAETLAIRLIGWSFILFAVYVLYESAAKLITADAPEVTRAGLAVALASLIVMPILYQRKMIIGRKLGSRSIIADATETLACIYLSLALLAGLGLNALFGLWWADPVAGLAIAVFLFKEGRELLEDAGRA
jgi:cation diffusion facilitator family transporter